jgi:hypothetical protein
MMSKKCKYTRETELDFFVPGCCVDEYGLLDLDEVEEPEDVYEWTHCPYCGKKIKTITGAN